MTRPQTHPWIQLRAILALGVVALLVVDLVWRRTWPVITVQILLIAGIVITSILDIRAQRHRGCSTSTGETEK